jgi:hypothetical protein
VSAEIGIGSGIGIEIVGGKYDTDFDLDALQRIDGCGECRAALDAGRPLVLG